LDARELAAAEKFMADVMTLFDGCLAKGGFTSSAAEFLDKYSHMDGTDVKVKEVFGVDVTRNP